MENNTYHLLNAIDYPADLRKLPVEQLPEVCSELRQRIIEVLAHHPGHLASSLGAVEITVALHYVFDTPNDRIVWDVGHQAYAHKILTGRRDEFDTNRQLGGLRPFPSPAESEYDSCVCGHASNSISMGLGMAVAARMQGNTQRKVAVVIGDGAMSGGLAFEGLNNVASTPNDMLIILNDNNMSIDRSVGGLKQYLLRLHTSKWYNRFRFKTARGLDRMGLLNEKRKNAILRLNNSLKSLITREQNIFEGLNIRYFGPADGHDVVRLVRMLQRIKDMSGPKMLHIHTVKGKGYEAAEKDAALWHAPGMFDPKTGERITDSGTTAPPKFQTVFGETLLELAKANDKIVGITPAMPSGCSMDIMMEAMPDRAFDVGIAEGHAVTLAAGMAKDGLLPFCNIYSSFAQRAYDNIIHDVAIGSLRVVLCLDRAGLVGEDGPTHHGAFDIAALRTVPNLTICSPMDEPELRNMMYTAQLPSTTGPWVIRYPRGRGSTPEWRTPMQAITVGTGRKLRSGDTICVLSLGPLGLTVEKAIDKNREARGESLESVAHYDMRFVKPLDEEIMREVAAAGYKQIITVEDGSLQGGFGSAVAEWLADHVCTTPLHRLGLPDHFVEHGPAKDLYRLTGLDEDSIAKTLTANL
ncbi:MAG: 1-deoxy-D-xylulose-5-phosphate synthase [Bacteroidaceae bacterium]|nr:1-deoxy-D-xylulose-5-phosphate synthase [Bacteroidaceae bacterium]